jgi:hypothetical protein
MENMNDYKNLNEHDLNRLAVELVYNSLPNLNITNKIRATDILGQNTPYDILWNDNKLCVRVANVSTTSRFPKWNYTLKAENRQMINFYILIALRDNDIFKIFVLPPEIIPETTVTISERVGQVRYSMFAVELLKIPQKIIEIKQNLDEYRRMYQEVKNG